MKVIVIVVVKARNRCWFKTIASEIGQNRIGNSWYIVAVVFVVAAAVHIVVPVDPRNLPLRFGQNRVINRWDLVVVVIIVVAVYFVVMLLLVQIYYAMLITDMKKVEKFSLAEFLGFIISAKGFVILDMSKAMENCKNHSIFSKLHIRTLFYWSLNVLHSQ